MASSDRLTIVVRGAQTHGAYPWLGVDPIVVASQIVLALQTIPSRQLDSRSRRRSSPSARSTAACATTSSPTRSR